ncbi:MAG: hypothetical protein AAFP03_02235 [Cyanobacteria bacterium J06598_3]
MVESTPVESTQSTPPDAAATPSAEEVAAVITELENYRERLVEDFMAAAKKAKLPKSLAMSQLKQHPEIVKIDTSLAQLRGETAPSE